jgi:hypothetical protein
MARHGLTEPVQRFPTSGALAAANRFVKLDSSGFLQLADEDDENAIGVGQNNVGAAANANCGVRVQLLNGPGLVEVEVAATVTLESGDIAYRAADGKVSDTGTVRAGVCLTGGSAGSIVELLPDCNYAFAAPE